jgi:hypothetical protein
MAAAAGKGEAMMGYPAEFEAFWAAYPKRVGTNPKKLAFRAWEKMRKQASAEDLTRAATNFAAECAKLKTDPAFVPHARTWLHQERWTDYVGTPTDTPPPDGEPMPELFHRLRARRPDLTEAVWKSWLAGLRFDQQPGRTTIAAPSEFIKNQCETRWGADLAVLLGRIDWRVGA